MDFAIQDKDGNLSLPNGQTVPSTQNGTTTPTTTGTTKPTPSSTTSSSIPLPTRTDPSQKSHTGTFGVKSGLAQMLKGGVIMDVMNVEQAKVAEEAGAVSVMALERIPSLIRSQGGIARMVSAADWVGGGAQWTLIGRLSWFLSSCFRHTTSDHSTTTTTTTSSQSI